MPDAEQKIFQKRQVAFKVRISDLLNGVFVKDDASAGYIKLSENVSRVNIISTVVYKSGQEQNFASCIIDDGTGKILLRTFENSNLFSKIDVGDAVLVVGKIREYNHERYILPEVIKKLENAAWANARKLEVLKSNIVQKEEASNENPAVIEQIASNDYNIIYSLIKKLDNGEGAAIDDVIKDSNTKDAENAINKLLENGDIFEIKPGRVKVLE